MHTHTLSTLLQICSRRISMYPCIHVVFVHNKQDTSPASLRGDITTRHVIRCLGTQQNQKWANDNILHTHHKTDGDVEEERKSAWHRLKSASQSNYSLILWKLLKCWPLGKSHDLQSHCIECILLLLLYPALRLVRGLSVCTAIFRSCCSWLMRPIFVDSIFLTKEELASPRGHRLFMYQIYFCCHGLTGFTSHLLGWCVCGG